MALITTFKKGQSVVWQDAPQLIVDMQFVNPGKGAAFSRLKFKNLKTGQTQEQTIKSGEGLEEANVAYKNTQFLYKEGDQYFFMDLETYDQFPIDADALGNQTRFFKDGATCKTMFVDDIPCSATLPLKMEFTVTQSPPGVKGDTATGGTKFVTIDTNEQIKVPLFIKEGDSIRVNTETGEYVERAS